MTQLSTHFSLEELTRSKAATKAGLKNQPAAKELAALEALCTNTLESIRAYFGKPITILSGYRCPAVNKLVGGAPDSQHLRGEAADITISGIANVDIYHFIKDNLDFDQVIAEKLKKDNGANGWVHVSYSTKNNRNDAISFLGKGRGYVKGLAFV